MKITRYLIYTGFVFFLFLYFHLFQNAFIDDAFITLRYVKTLLMSGTWGFFPGYTANSATSPLNVLLLAGISVFTGPTVQAAMVLAILCFALMAGCLPRISLQLTGAEGFGWLAVGALLFNPLLISTLGLESILFTALFVLSIYYYQLQKWDRLAVVLALLTLTRADGVILAVLFLLFLPAADIKKRFAILYLLCILPWHLFSWIRLGSFLPDTFFIKTDQRAWMRWDYFNGMADLYYHVYPWETILSFLFLPSILILFYRKARELKILTLIGMAGLLHFLAYSLLHVPPFHWYYVPQAMALSLLGSLGLGVLYRNVRAGWQRKAILSLLVMGFITPPLGMFYLLSRERFVVKEMPIHSNWATYGQYKQTGLWLKQNYAGQTIRLVTSEIGTLSYYCDCYLLDQFSDRSWLRDYIAQRELKPGISSFPYRINFAFYDPPAFPQVSYVLRAYSSEPQENTGVIQQFRISTKWIKQGYLVLSAR